LETWQDATNPLPDVAGLKYVLTRMLAEKIPLSKVAQTAAKRLLQQLPELPSKEVGGKTILAAAERVSGESKGAENPELYAVFPFRLYGVDKPEIEIVRNTFEQRKYKQSGGWRPDGIQAAYLGLAKVAQEQVIGNFTSKTEQRFPAFWSSEDDWTPDQAHGNVAAMALQAMLLQADGSKLLVSPAWPKDWDVEFKLQGPNSTVLEGTIKGGKIEVLKTNPDKRTADVVRLDPQ
jgi:hypothetical protein